MNDSNSRNNKLIGFGKFTNGYEGKFTNDMRGCVWVGQRFLSHDKWQVKLLCDFFTIHILHFTNDSNSRINNS